MSEPDFQAGMTFTAYLDEHPDVAAHLGPTADDRVALIVAATLHDEATNRRVDDVTGFAPSGWRNLRVQGQRRVWFDDAAGSNHQIEYVRRGDRFDVLLGAWPSPEPDGSLPDDARRRAAVRLLHRDGDKIVIELDGHRHRVTVRTHPEATVLATSTAGGVTLTRPQRWVDHDEAAAGGGPVCPLPGTVIAVHVEAGTTVAEGELLMVVEAMKMEHKIVAPAPAVVGEVLFGVGDRVDQGDLLVALEATEEHSD